MTARSPGSTAARRRGGSDATAKASAYARNRETTRRISMEKSRSGRDIGPLPKVKNRPRRAKCAKSLRLFCETYLGATFPLAWSDDHLQVITLIERAVLSGGQFAVAMPRGSGKTSLCEAACLWAELYGHRRFVVLIGADAGAAEIMLESLKSELEHNDLLAEDFPEACFPVRRLEGIYQRAAGQLLDGRPTEIEWTQFGVVMPRVKGSPCSGSVFVVAGLTGGLRGLKRKTAEGETIRPDLVLVDDPQTDESARSPSQSANRERILKGAILGLAGPGKRIAGLAAVTVVEKGDLAERLLDRELNPTWQGLRMKLMRSMPADTALWDEYSRIRREGQAEGLSVEAVATRCGKFYREHRAAMDAGAAAAWEHRKEPDELSAVQHAMNLKIDRGDAAFFAEYQNEPIARDEVTDGAEVRAGEFAKRVNGLARGVVPHAAQYITAFIDVQKPCLYWVVVAWADDFTGWVLDYSAYPDQGRSYFHLRDVRRTLQAAFPGAAIEGAIRGGLDKLVPWICQREWPSEDGSSRRVDRVFIDAGWGEMSDVVYSFCRATPHSNTVMPSIGRYVGASSLPFSEYKRVKGDRVGLNWRVPIAKPGAQPVRRVLFDTNWWKTIVSVRATTAVGDPGSLTLFGKTGADHSLFADQMASEYRVRTQGRERSLDEWHIRVPGRDNHFLDCVVGCAVGASMCGAMPPGISTHVRPRRRVSFAQMRAKAAGR